MSCLLKQAGDGAMRKRRDGDKCDLASITTYCRWMHASCSTAKHRDASHAAPSFHVSKGTEGSWLIDRSRGLERASTQRTKQGMNNAHHEHPPFRVSVSPVVS